MLFDITDVDVSAMHRQAQARCCVLAPSNIREIGNNADSGQSKLFTVLYDLDLLFQYVNNRVDM